MTPLRTTSLCDHVFLASEYSPPVPHCVSFNVAALQPSGGFPLLRRDARFILKCSPGVKYPTVIKENGVSLLKSVCISISGVVQQVRELSQGGKKHRRGGQQERRLERRRVVKLYDGLAVFGQLDGRVLKSKVMTVVDIMEWNKCRSEHVKMKWVLFFQFLRRKERIDEIGCTSLNLISEAMENLVLRWILEV